MVSVTLSEEFGAFSVTASGLSKEQARSLGSQLNATVLGDVALADNSESLRAVRAFLRSVSNDQREFPADELGNKISLIKAARAAVPGLSLIDAKHLVEEFPIR